MKRRTIARGVLLFLRQTLVDLSVQLFAGGVAPEIGESLEELAQAVACLAEAVKFVEASRHAVVSFDMRDI